LIGFFTTANWISDYPNCIVFPLAHTRSNHVPCVVNIDTVIPKSNLFRFENFWVDQPRFMDCVENSSKQASHKKHCFVMMADKLKSLRYALKHW
jgi:hypothetical protein